MAFHYPAAFYLLIPFAAVIAIFAWSRWKRVRELGHLGDWRLVKELVPIAAIIRRRRKDTLALLGLALLLFSAAGPQFGSNLKEVKHTGVDVFIAVDTSRSMLAEDVPPSRMDHAKRSLGLLISKLESNRVGIIAFAKRALLQCPLTVDSDAARMFLDVLDDNTVPEQGTSLGDAIRLAIQSFPKESKTGRVLVLLTDGEDHKSDPVGAAKEAKEAGVVIFTIGIGTSKGEVIKDRDEEGKITQFHKYQGEMVLSRLDDGLLNQIASITGGRYYRASSTDQEIDEIAAAVNNFEKREFGTKVYDRLQERYMYFLVIAFLLLLWEFFFAEMPGQIKRVLAVFARALLLLLILAPAQPARADYRDHVRKGNRLLQKGDPAGARAEFESAQIDVPEAPFLPYNIAATYYLEGNFDDARKQYERAMTMTNDPSLRSKIEYNLGHLSFNEQKRDEAVEHFKKCLKLNPQDVDAKYNIEYIKSGKQPKNPPQQQQNKNGSGQNKQQPQQQGQGDKDQKGDQNQQQQQTKPGDISKENAERVLQMIKDQESEKMKNAKIPKATLEKGKKKDQGGGGEDW